MLARGTRSATPPFKSKDDSSRRAGRKLLVGDGHVFEVAAGFQGVVEVTDHARIPGDRASAGHSRDHRAIVNQYLSKPRIRVISPRPGELLDQQIWMDRYPDLGSELAEFIADQQSFERLVDSLHAPSLPGMSVRFRSQ